MPVSKKYGVLLWRYFYITFRVHMHAESVFGNVRLRPTTIFYSKRSALTYIQPLPPPLYTYVRNEIAPIVLARPLFINATTVGSLRCHYFPCNLFFMDILLLLRRPYNVLPHHSPRKRTSENIVGRPNKMRIVETRRK